MDETGKLPSRKRELFILYCVANLKDSLFSPPVCSVSGTRAASKEVAQIVCDKLMTGVPEVPCCRGKPKFSKVAVSVRCEDFSPDDVG